MSVSVYVYMCAHMYHCPERPEEGLGSSEARFIGGRKLPKVDAGKQYWGNIVFIGLIGFVFC